MPKGPKRCSSWGTAASIVTRGVAGHGAHTALCLLHLEGSLTGRRGGGGAGGRFSRRESAPTHPTPANKENRQEPGRADPAGRPALSPKVRPEGRVGLSQKDLSKMTRRVRNALAEDWGTWKWGWRTGKEKNERGKAGRYKARAVCRSKGPPASSPPCVPVSLERKKLLFSPMPLPCLFPEKVRSALSPTLCPLASVPTALLNYSAKSHQGPQRASLPMRFLQDTLMTSSPPLPALFIPPQKMLFLTCFLKCQCSPELCLDPLPLSPSTHSEATSCGSHHPLGAKDSPRTSPAIAANCWLWTVHMAVLQPLPLNTWSAELTNSQTSGKNWCITFPSPNNLLLLPESLLPSMDLPPAQSPK